jgi:hypothetical protein
MRDGEEFVNEEFNSVSKSYPDGNAAQLFLQEKRGVVTPQKKHKASPSLKLSHKEGGGKHTTARARVANSSKDIARCW